MAAANRFLRLSVVLLTLFLAPVLVWCFMNWPANRTFKLKDGTTLRLEKISYGVRDTNYMPLGLADRLRVKFGPMLPKSIRTRLFTNVLPSFQRSFGGGWTLHTNPAGLNLWFTRRDTKGNLVDVGIRDAELLDGQEDVYFLSQTGGEMFGRPGKATGIWVSNSYYSQANLVWLTFEGSPRHEKRFRLRLGGSSGEYLGEFTIDNPGPGPSDANWATRSLPATNVEGGLSFALTQVALKSNPAIYQQLTNLNPSEDLSSRPLRSIAPLFEAREGGSVSTEWRTTRLEGWDSSSNYATRRNGIIASLDPDAKAWKLTVSFYGTEHTALASNDVIVFTNVPVPQAGELLPLDRHRSISGLDVQLIALCGPGDVTFSDRIPVEVVKSPDLTPGFTNLPNTNRDVILYERVRSPVVQLVVRIGGYNDANRTTIRAVDNLGREFYAGYSLYGGSAKLPDSRVVNLLQAGGSQFPVYYALDLPPDAKTVDLYFCVHHPHNEEFIFRPPQSAPLETRAH